MGVVGLDVKGMLLFSRVLGRFGGMALIKDQRLSRGSDGGCRYFGCTKDY